MLLFNDSSHPIGYLLNVTIPMKYAPPERLVRDAHKLQDLTSRVDPPAIWRAEPAQVNVLAHNLRGFVFNPLDLQTYGFYPMYRS